MDATPIKRREYVVLDGVSLDIFMGLLLDNHAKPSTLVVCSTEEVLIQRLVQAIPSNPGIDEQPHPLLSKTLRTIGQSRTLQVAFCPSLEVLRAYLSTYTADDSPPEVPTLTSPSRQPVLAILDILDIHRESSYWSAQGLSQTFAMAVEAASRAKQRLLIAESVAVRDTGTGHEGVMGHETNLDDDGTGDRVDAQAGEAGTRRSAWDEQVAILNVATKSFGAGERGWAGRTVTIRRVAERWCTVKKMEMDSRSA